MKNVIDDCGNPCGKCVAIGASVAWQALQAGLVDEMYLHIAPIILGSFKRLFDQARPRPIHLKHLETLDTADAQHMR
ncbi:dihydrofolate reductase family protein [Terracidiphilus sp.]|uniref:dihydrofolate reductase family protein n=1 Tax=Terracidiphilus sp. TaxID=1964191 RepID=UPI003C281016